MQPLQICIGPNIRIGRESWCLPYAGFFFYMCMYIFNFPNLAKSSKIPIHRCMFPPPVLRSASSAPPPSPGSDCSCKRRPAASDEVLRCCSVAVLHYCTTALLQCCTTALLQCCRTAVLHCCIAAVLQCCNATVRTYRHL